VYLDVRGGADFSGNVQMNPRLTIDAPDTGAASRPT
jgi:hypothetical protein